MGIKNILYFYYSFVNNLDVQINTLTPGEEILINKFVHEITEKIDVESVYLFGSRARGEGDIESDIDIAVIVKDRKRIKYFTKQVTDISIKIEEELDVIGELMLSPIIINDSLLKTDIGIGRRIREEGILLWSKRSKKRK
ncbi:MAG TPA: nucleotidyltransferase domain-containing protein [Thermodesulfovibrionales bacterium]|nr:nucleotidyltransferase domain-containing protein [Thermodesulfovibrionales bacterium]